MSNVRCLRLFFPSILLLVTAGCFAPRDLWLYDAHSCLCYGPIPSAMRDDGRDPVPIPEGSHYYAVTLSEEEAAIYAKMRQIRISIQADKLSIEDFVALMNRKIMEADPENAFRIRFVFPHVWYGREDDLLLVSGIDCQNESVSHVFEELRRTWQREFFIRQLDENTLELKISNIGPCWMPWGDYDD